MTTRRTFGKWLAAAAAAPLYAQPSERVLPIQGNCFLLTGPESNTIAQVGAEGVLLVDSQGAAQATGIMAEVRKLSAKPLRYIINTHAHEDHVGGNEALSKMGQTIVGGNVAGQLGGSDAATAEIIAHENLLNRLSAQTPKLPFGMLPTNTYFTDRKDLYFNGEAIQCFHPKSAHTDTDTIVFFRRSDVVCAGDIFEPGTYPFLDLERGGSINGLVDALNFILDLTVPADKQEGGTIVVPGHGRLCDEADVVEYRDMLTIVRDRIRDMVVKKNMTLEQVKAAKPTSDYDPLYAPRGGAAVGRFVEGMFKTIKL
jgi:glyoxylase-like metal-dependent hydrolase (beta-lactamase superfamily II)